MKEHKFTNQLIHETSPYLLQHAHNPVNWHSWNKKTLEKAKKEDKMILVSIGYSACHWCHVMEHESFENEEVAKVMNDHFICVKVDREERPDVDQVYMDAVQIISGRGGWPLNCFALPDGKPFWGATYFKRDQWLEILRNVTLLFDTQREKLEQQADDIYQGISKHSFVKMNLDQQKSFSRKDADEMAYVLGSKIDRDNGGFQGAPRFPMPNNFLFLLRYHYHSKNPEAFALVELTLEKMAQGGIYDQLGGGFARYSVDDRWHVPHFEKMLYDNAQLVSLYAEAYQVNRNPLFAEVISETLDFIKRELTSPEGGFYSALDADSEGIEGKYYVWEKEEFEKVVGSDSGILSAYFGIGEDAYWEEGNNILIRASSLTELSIQYKYPLEKVKEIIDRGKQKLFDARTKRIRPGLDDKILTSWNALMLRAYIDAYRALDRKDYLETAIQNADFICQYLIQKDGQLKRTSKQGASVIDGFLDDYSFLIDAFISLYEVTFDEKWLNFAKLLADYTMNHFYDEDSGMFFYTSDLHSDTIARKIEVTDNVIPASCSSLARSLYALGLLFEHQPFTDISLGMLQKVTEKMLRFPSAFSNWGVLSLNLAYSFHTVVISSPEAGALRNEIKNHYLPNLLYAGGLEKSDLPITANRWDPDKTRIFVCTGSECKLPVETVAEALEQIEE